jgi:hypothetical protein
VYALLEGILFSVIHTTNKSPKEEREWRGVTKSIGKVKERHMTVRVIDIWNG